MKYRYSKYTGEDLDELDLEELLSRLSDLLLSSGFDDPYGMPGEDGRSMQALHDAILEALLNGGLLSDETLEKMFGKGWQDRDDAEARLDELIDKIIEKLQKQGYVTASPDRRGRSGAAGAVRARDSGERKRRSSSRSPTRASTSSATGRCAICSDRSARAASAGTTRARWPPASRRAARPSRTSSATR